MRNNLYDADSCASSSLCVSLPGSDASSMDLDASGGEEGSISSEDDKLTFLDLTSAASDVVPGMLNNRVCACVPHY